MKFALILAAALVFASPAGAFELQTASSVSIPAGTTVDDDLLASGSSVNIAGDVAGSALAAGSNVDVAGSVEGLLGAAGGTVTASGAQETVYAAGGTVTVRNLTARNAALAGGTVDVDAESNISRDLLAAGGTTTVRGTIGRHLRAAGGNVRIGANVGGNVYANGSMISLLPGAVVQGDFIYESPVEAQIAEGATIGGRIIPRIRERAPTRPPRVLSALWGLAALYALGAVMLGLSPAWTAATAANIARFPGWSVLWGLIALIVTPIAAVLAMITIIGIPLGIAILLSYIIALLVAAVLSGLALGALILRERSIWLQLLVGLVIIVILGAVPFLGGLVWLAAILFGLGAIWLGFVRRTAPAEPA